MAIHRPSNSHNENNTHQGYSPEGFGFSKTYVESVRKNIFLNVSDGLFLYERNDLLDHTGIENGTSYFKKISNSEIYNAKVTKVEESLFLAHQTQLKKFISKRTHHVEHGPGLNLANKLKNIIYPLFLKGNKREKVHVGVDISGITTQECAKEYNSTDTPGLSFAGINEDWRTAKLIQYIVDKVYYILGGSIGNYDDETVEKILANLKSDSYVVGRDIIISHFLAPTGPDKDSKIQNIKHQYYTPEGEIFIFKGFEAIGIDTRDLEFAVDYEEGVDGNADAVKVGAKLLKDMTVDIGGGEMLTKKAGDHIWAIRSRRYNPTQFDYLAQSAGCTLKEEFEDDDRSMRLAVYRSPRKKISPLMHGVAWTSLALFLVLGGAKLGALQEKSKWDNKQQQKIHDLFLDVSNGLKGGYDMGINAKLMPNRLLAILQKRYGMHLDDEQRKRIMSLLFDRVKSNPLYSQPNMDQGMYRGDGLYNPSVIERFIGDHPIYLSEYGSIVPNESLTQYQDALKNSYFYTGERLSFTQADEELPDFIPDVVSESEQGEFDFYEKKCGLKKLHGKLYFVVQLAKDGPYILDTSREDLNQMGSDAREVTTNIIQKGEIPLLAEKIRQFINLKLSIDPEDHSLYAMNGQGAIAKFLTDLYAQGYDLGYLMGEGNGLDYYDKTTLIESFILGVMMPAVETNLQTKEYDKMHDVDRAKVRLAKEKYKLVQSTQKEIFHYLQTYVPEIQYANKDGQIQSIILRGLLLEQAWNFIENERDMRCWLTEHSGDFANVGIYVPPFPMWPDTGYTNKHFNPDILIDNLHQRDVYHDGYVTSEFPTYTGIDGTRYCLALYPKSSIGKQTFVACSYNLNESDQLWEDYQKGKYGKVYNPDTRMLRGIQQEFVGRQYVIPALFEKLNIYSTQAVKDLFSDYKLWKKAMDEYQAKKGRS